MRYQSEEAGELSFEAEQLIKVVGPSPSDPEYQSLGETLDGERAGSFPKVCRFSLLISHRLHTDRSHIRPLLQEFVEKVPESEREDHDEAGPSLASATSDQPAPSSSSAPTTAPISIPQPAAEDDPKPTSSDVASSPALEKAPIAEAHDNALLSPASAHPPHVSPIDTSVPQVTPAPSVPASETDMPENPVLNPASPLVKEEATPSPVPSAPSPSTSAPALKPPPSPSKAPSAPSSPGAVKVGGMSASDATSTIRQGMFQRPTFSVVLIH